jgi:hypothetical protein
MKSNKNELQKIFSTFIIFTLIDSLYLMLSKSHFENLVKQIQSSPLQIKVVPTLLCYFALVFGLYYFIIREKKSILEAGLLGLTIYSVYEMTNLAIFRKWDIKIAIVDILWGGFLFSLSTFLIYKFFG